MLTRPLDGVGKRRSPPPVLLPPTPVSAPASPFSSPTTPPPPPVPVAPLSTHSGGRRRILPLHCKVHRARPLGRGRVRLGQDALARQQAAVRADRHEQHAADAAPAPAIPRMHHHLRQGSSKRVEPRVNAGVYAVRGVLQTGCLPSLPASPGTCAAAGAAL